ncbi:MAG: methylated-DNA--[protein]-cysteine S-methyltransferase [Pseudomonadales bacterium]|nr:methylated-DNA--[protein]-cysteine S-methyltransferase [Pseudomonadales bacterium]
MNQRYTYCDSPVGALLLAGDGERLELIGFPEGKARMRHGEGWQEDRQCFREAIRQLDAYFAGELQDFDVPLAPKGTEFQQRVWQALTRIPYAATCSYGEIARQIGSPGASRAVGAANGQNPIPIIIPCHRVIGSTGKLTGFGGGLAAKETLLALEQRFAPFELRS